MALELYLKKDARQAPRSCVNQDPAPAMRDFAFLNNVVTPIYLALKQVCTGVPVFVPWTLLPA